MSEAYKNWITHTFLEYFYFTVPTATVKNFTMKAISANSILLMWSSLPAIDVNGELVMYIIEYRIIEQLGFGTSIPENVGLVNTVYVTAERRSHTIAMLDNYTMYEANISAVTIGAGPPATETERTKENG